MKRTIGLVSFIAAVLFMLAAVAKYSAAYGALGALCLVLGVVFSVRSAKH